MGRKIKVTVDVDKLSRAGGYARAAALTAEERTEAARKAVKARWAKWREQHADKKKKKHPAKH